MEPNTQAVQQAPQAEEQSVGSLARGFLDDLDANPDPNQFDERQEEVEQEAQEQPEEQEGEVQAEAEEATPQEPEIPLVEFELEDGSKVQIPEAIKPHVMRDKDYRQKTMAIAETRKQLEQLTATAQQLATQAQQMAPYHAQLFAMDSRANQIQQSLTQELMTNDPIEFNRMQGELAILLRNRDSLAGGLQQQTAYLTQQQNELRAKQLAIDAPKLFEEVPEIAKPETQKALAAHARSLGFSEAEIEHMNYSTAAAKVLWESLQFRAMKKAQETSKAKLQVQAKTAPTVGKTGQAIKSEAKSKQVLNEWKKSGGGRDSPHFRDVLRSITRG